MLYGHFQVNRPVGTGHSRPNDVKRLRRALNETSHASSPPNPSGHYNATAIASIERFQRDHGLKPDGIVLPGGPTERVLDMVLAARREGGPAAQEQLRELLRTAADAELTFQPTGDDDRPGVFVDRNGEIVSPDRLHQVLKERSATRPVVLAMMDDREFLKKPWDNIVGSGSGGGVAGGGAAAAAAAIGEWLRQQLGGGQTQQKQPERQPRFSSPAPQPAGGPEHDRPNRRSTPTKRTEIVDAEIRTPPFPAQPSKGLEDRKEELLPVPGQLPNRTEFPAEEPRPPQILIFPDQSDQIPQLMILHSHRGNDLTKAQILRAQVEIMRQHPDWQHIGGGYKLTEELIASGELDIGVLEERKETAIKGPGSWFLDHRDKPGDGRPGSRLPDLLFEAPGGKLHAFNTVDVDANGQIAQHELDAAESMRRHGINVYLIKKTHQMKR